MNNQRNNNRRRGRGGNRGGGGNQNQANRIDSRARGNAPQLLEKYKKLAHEASLNDDRVQTEYYLQFADHYFRVIVDGKAQKEEAQAKRNAEREQDDSDDFEGEREERGEDDRNRKPRRSRKDGNGDESSGREGQPNEGRRGSEGDDDDGENPFVAKPRKKKARKPVNEDDSDGGIDPDMLPPSIARSDDSGGDEDEEPAPKPRRPRARKPRGSDGEEELQAAS